MFLEPACHHKLARGIDFGELAASHIGVAVDEDNLHAPLATDLQVCLPVGLAIKVWMAPPAFYIIGCERLKDALGRRSDVRGRDYQAGTSVYHSMWRTPL
jgi:hypothetical protein